MLSMWGEGREGERVDMALATIKETIKENHVGGGIPKTWPGRE
jgi:hypothetical protein